LKGLDKDAHTLFREVMTNCKAERKAKSKLSNKQLAKTLEITENYISALESARATPSLRLLFKYLIACGFDDASLKELSINDPNTIRPQNKERQTLIQKVYSLDDEQVGFLIEQVKVAEVFNMKIKSKK
jgi:transcriptional regulator with XRE-family HTH domain